MEELSKNSLRPLLIGLIIILVPLIISFIFKENDGSNGRVLKQDFEFKDYEVNEVIPVYITDEERVKKYYSEFMDILINDPEKAFTMLDDETLIEKFDSYKSFKSYLDTLKQKKGFYTTTVRNYSNEMVDGKRVYFAMDSIGNEYGFVESSIMNYKVRIY